MTEADERELDRLCGMLSDIEAQVPETSREALRKAGLALALAFVHGLRPQLEDWYRRIDEPISDEERSHLRRLGIDPDAGK